MWHVYNLISEGDEVRAKTDRKVHSTSNTGTTTSYRVQLALTIVVKRVSRRLVLPSLLYLPLQHLGAGLRRSGGARGQLRFGHCPADTRPCSPPPPRPKRPATSPKPVPS